MQVESSVSTCQLGYTLLPKRGFKIAPSEIFPTKIMFVENQNFAESQNQNFAESQNSAGRDSTAN